MVSYWLSGGRCPEDRRAACISSSLSSFFFIPTTWPESFLMLPDCGFGEALRWEGRGSGAGWLHCNCSCYGTPKARHCLDTTAAPELVLLLTWAVIMTRVVELEDSSLKLCPLYGPRAPWPQPVPAFGNLCTSALHPSLSTTFLFCGISRIGFWGESQMMCLFSTWTKKKERGRK